MNVSRIAGLALVAAASFALSACGGGGAPTTATAATAPTSTAASYTGPAPATADVQAFEINFWNNVRVQNRCGQCHNATSPAQMPNFARSDDVNLAYAQANTVVNLSSPATSLIVTKVTGGHNCWLADPSACGTILTTWISNWAGATGATSATQVQLQAPPIQSVGQSLNFPNDGGVEYSNTIYKLTSVYCVRCHSSTASAATQQSPYFADPTLTIAYPAAIPKIDLTGCSPFVAGSGAGACGTNSRFYQRLLTDNHNCWDNCASDAAQMLAQIQAFAQSLTPSNIDPSLVVSKALTLTQGTVASGANRFDADTIAKYEFQTGSGYTAYDTSGVDPAADLTISGNVLWAGGWGITVGAGGKAQASTSASAKIYNMIQATGEFSVEAWVAPALVAVDKSYMVSYSGGDTLRNFTLGQTNQNYDFMLRSSNSVLDGTPQLATPDRRHAAAGVIAARGADLRSHQRTPDLRERRECERSGPAEGRHDLQLGQHLRLGARQRSVGRSLLAGIDQVRRHPQPRLSAAQVMQNFNAGVGQRYYMLFNVASVTGCVAGLRDVHGQPVRQLQLPLLPADLHFAGSDGHAEHSSQHSRQGHPHRLERQHSAGGAGLHTAEHHGDRGRLYRPRVRCCRRSVRSSACRAAR